MRKDLSILEIHTAVFLFGMAGLFGKFLSLSLFIIVFGRTFFASVCLFIILRLFKYRLKIPSKGDLYFLIALGILLAAHWASFFHSIQISTVAIGLLTFSTFPVFVVFIEPYVSKSRLNPKNIILVLILFTGIILIVPKFDLADLKVRGVLWGILSGFLFALLTVFNRKYVQKYSPLIVAFYQNSIAAIVLIPAIIFIKIKIVYSDVLLLLVLGIFCTAIAHTLFIKGMKRVKAESASIIACLEPVYGILFAALLLSEYPDLKTLMGGAIIILCALYTSIRSRLSL